jgi:hypothetical protein
MRGDDHQQGQCSVVCLRKRGYGKLTRCGLRGMVDNVWGNSRSGSDTMYARVGRPSIAPEKLLAAQSLQIRSGRLLTEEMDTTCCSAGSWG